MKLVLLTLAAAGLLGTGCLAPSYMKPEQPYGGSSVIYVYHAAYDAGVVLQPHVFGTVIGLDTSSPLARDFVLTLGMPVALGVSLVVGTASLPFVLIGEAIGWLTEAADDTAPPRATQLTPDAAWPPDEGT